MSSKYLIIIAGPTAVGKTGLAVKLATHFRTEIINADSRQVYREMVIGTAVPTPGQLSAVKHQFIGHKSIHEYYNASLFELEAIERLEQLFAGLDIVVMVGGSGMYIDAVCRGIDDIPAVIPQIRERVNRDYVANGLKGIQDKLRIVDPEYYRKVDLNNPKRIMKALEISMMTGKPYSSFLTGNRKQRKFIPVKIGLDMPRPELHNRINSRVDHMMKNGLLQEAEGLYRFSGLNALNTLGYKELFEFFNGKYSLEEAVNRIKGHSRQYARRQLTWFHKDNELHWFHPDEYEAVVAYIEQKILI